MTRPDGSIVRSRGPRCALAATLLGLALVAACSTPVPAIVVEVVPVTAEVIRGASVAVTVTLARLGGAADPVALAVTGLPADVAASFAPATLAGAASSSTLTLTATPATLEGTTTVTVTGTMGARTDDATFTLDVRSLTVDGRVLTIVGSPLPFIGVSSQGRAATSVADGTFRLTGLALPYDLTLASASGDGGMHVFEGLTTPTPIVSPQFAANPGAGTPVRTASLDGSVLGGAAVPPNHVAVVCVEGLDVAIYGCDRLAAGDTGYAFTATWVGASAAVPVRVHALYVELDANDLPVAYPGYGRYEAVLTAGVPLTRAVVLGSVPTTRLQVSVAVPGPMTLQAVEGFARFGPNLTLMAFQTTSVAPAYDVLMPALPGVTYDVVAIASAGGTSSSLAWLRDTGPDAGALTVPSPPELVTPAAGATNVDLATTFTATDAGAVRTFIWYPTVGGPKVALTTARSRVTIPDPTIVGLPFAAGATAEWTVFGLGVDAVDDAGTRDLMAFYALLTSPSAGGPGVVAGDGSVTTSAVRGFQFAP